MNAEAPAEFPGPVRTVLLSAGVAAATLGFVVIGSWLTGQGTSPGVLTDPMPFNTALGFVLLGLALVALASQRIMLALGAAALAAIYGVLTLLQHITNHSLSLEQLFFVLPADGHTAFLGRAAPNTGLAFVLLGISIALLALGRGMTSRATVALLGAGTGVVALVDLAGRIGILVTQGHGVLVPQMALHTAAAAVILASAILYCAWVTPHGVGNYFSARSGLMAGVSVVLFSVVLAQMLRLQERRQIHKTVDVAAEAFAEQVKRNLESRAFTTLSMARAVSGVTTGGLKSFAEALVDSGTSRRAVAWIDGKGARWLKVATTDSSLLFHPWWPDSSMLRQADTSEYVSGLHTLGAQTYIGVGVRTQNREGVGYFWAISDVKQALAFEFSKAPEEFTVRVTEGTRVLYQTPGNEIDSVWSSQASIDAAPVRWTVTATPTGAALRRARSALPIITLTAGMLVATLLGVSVTLGREARLKAGEIEAAHQQLTTEIHEREAAQAALRVSEEQLRQAHKLEAVGRLAGGIAHDYNNILTVIRGNAQTLLLHEQYAGLGRDALEHIDRAAARGSLLTARLLAFSQRQILQPESLAVGELVAGLKDELAQLLGPQVSLRIERKPGADVVEVDRRWLSQVILDLGFNAREAMPTGGTLWIRTRPADADLRRLYGVTQVTGDAVVLEIEDSGRGMDDATRTRLFEPFFSTKKFGQGAGLALASAYGIVRQSQGEIAVRSTPGQGTRVGIFLPSATSEAAPAAGPIAPGTIILVAEDEPGVLRFMKRTLEHAGCRVVAGPSAEAALEALEESGLVPDMLVTDIIMPGISGVELASEMRLRVPGLAVLFVSAYTSDALKERGIESLGAYLLQKPFTSAELLEQIGRTISVSTRVG